MELSVTNRQQELEGGESPLHPNDQTLINEKWRDVVRRRSAELRSGAVEEVSWDEVKRRADEITKTI
ncbi:MAG: hypothetical protein C0483_09335 [Pirellula sp.]|nr:hypothetical protein [Pirellula sp.]